MISTGWSMGSHATLQRLVGRPVVSVTNPNERMGIGQDDGYLNARVIACGIALGSGCASGTPWPPRSGLGRRGHSSIFPPLFLERVNPMRLTGDRNQCQGCKEFFNSTAAFDKHRTGQHGVDRRCLTAGEMTDKGMAKSSTGFWVGSPMTDAALLQRAGSADQEACGTHVATHANNA
jgi:hypothetical protein